MKLKPVLICVQPTIKYFAWQIEVMLTNFKSLELHKHFQIQILFAYNNTLATCENDISWGKSVEDKFTDVASFHYYNDTRQNISYISSIRPHILKKHFKELTELSKRVIFYHDCDILFTKFPEFILNLSDDDDNWYVSDTKSYIGYNYIKSKGDDVLEAMCKIVGVNSEFIKEREEQSGGAQYILKGVDWVFFDKMEKDCENLFRNITILNNQKKQSDPTHHELQIWCADMWAILWNGWLRGYKTNIIPEMDFCWATDSIDNYENKYIFHNAGVTDTLREQIFFKGDYRDKLPYSLADKYDQSKASYKYFQVLKSVTDSNLPVKEVYENLVASYPPDVLKDEMKQKAYERLKICLMCEQFNNINGQYRCNKCGCSTKAKVFMGSLNDCPESKWKI